MKKIIAAAFAVAFVVTGSATLLGQQPGTAEPAGAGSVERRIGSIKAIAGGNIRLKPDSGPEVNVTVDPAAQILRIAPGERNLKNATRLQFEDLQVGDRILVAGKPGSDQRWDDQRGHPPPQSEIARGSGPVLQDDIGLRSLLAVTGVLVFAVTAGIVHVIESPVGFGVHIVLTPAQLSTSATYLYGHLSYVSWWARGMRISMVRAFYVAYWHGSPTSR